MKILHCDVCHAEVNEYAHWYNDRKPRNMYELNCIHESNSNTLGSNTYDGMIVCHECMEKLLNKAESEENNISGKPKGKWNLLVECSNSGYYCTNCNKKLVKEGWSNTVKKIKFCPNCGADMREAEE